MSEESSTFYNNSGPTMGKTINIDTNNVKIGSIKYVDTGSGFLLEEFEDVPQAKPKEQEAPIFGGTSMNCLKCDKRFMESWLFDNFKYKCCDTCRSLETPELITKTDAVNTFLLKPIDLEKDRPLRFITRKNPHNPKWGQMKLYLKSQVEERALEIWDSLENIETERAVRDEKKMKTKAKKYQKELKALRMNMRSSLYDRTSTASHTHEFGPETYNEEDDTYTRKCISCSYSENFEKM